MITKINILIVDNDKDMSWLVAHILREESFKVDITYDVESALEKIEKHFYHLIVLDYKLAGNSGLFVLDKTRQISPATMIIMMSAFGNELVKARAREFGAYAFLDKPFNINRLKVAVKHALIEQKRRCVNEAKRDSKHSYSTSGGYFGRTCFSSRDTNSNPATSEARDRYLIHTGTS